METKREIRTSSLKKRRELSTEVRQEYSRRILKHVISHPYFQKADEMYCYASFREEADTFELIQTALDMGKKVAVPRVIVDNRMEFLYISGLDELRPGYQGIPEPDYCASKLVSKKGITHSGIVLMIVPGAAFDRNGNRIGYGKGFYDAYLCRYPHCRTIGAAFSTQCVDSIPAEEHDIRMDLVITERGIFSERKDER